MNECTSGISTGQGIHPISWQCCVRYAKQCAHLASSNKSSLFSILSMQGFSALRASFTSDRFNVEAQQK